MSKQGGLAVTDSLMETMDKRRYSYKLILGIRSDLFLKKTCGETLIIFDMGGWGLHKKMEQAGAELCQAQLPTGILLNCDLHQLSYID